MIQDIPNVAVISYFSIDRVSMNYFLRVKGNLHCLYSSLKICRLCRWFITFLP